MNIWKAQFGEILSSVSLSKLTRSKQESASAIDVWGNIVSQDSEDDSDKFITLPQKFIFLIISFSFARREIRPCSGDFLPVVLLLSTGPHSLTLLTRASAFSFPDFMPSYSSPAYYSHGYTNLAHSPFRAFSCAVLTASKVLPGFARVTP